MQSLRKMAYLTQIAVFRRVSGKGKTVNHPEALACLQAQEIRMTGHKIWDFH
jgi:hypothetical protein